MKRIQLKTLCGCIRQLDWLPPFPRKVIIPLVVRLKNPFVVSEGEPLDPPKIHSRTFVLSNEVPSKGIDAVFIEEDK